MKTWKDLTTEITRREGGTVKLNIAEISEVVGIISDLVVEDAHVISILIAAGDRRARKGIKPVRKRRKLRAAALLALLSLMILAGGCASPGNQSGFVMTPHGPGAQVDFLQVREEYQSGQGGLNPTRVGYMDNWRRHPWLMAFGHAGAGMGIYLIGDNAGWWGSSSSSSSTHEQKPVEMYTSSVSSGGDLTTINVTGDGNQLIWRGDELTFTTFQPAPTFGSLP